MLKVKAKLQAPLFDLLAYKLALEQLARETMSLAMFEYVVTATEIIPVWSGASQATLTELASLAGTPLTITPSIAAFDDRAFGATRGDASLDIDGTTGKFAFTYQTDLPWLIYNEYHNANEQPDETLFGKLKNPGPYHFQDATAKRVRSVFQRFRGPDLNRNIKIKKVK